MEVRLTCEPLFAGALLESFSRGRQESGAIASFTGLARAEGGEVEALELDAYLGFAEAVILRTLEETAARFDLHDALVVHRIGRVAPGEVIVFLAVAARRRRAAFEGADCLMDYLKSRAPFWKKSHERSGARWILPAPEDYEDAARWDAPDANHDL